MGHSQTFLLSLFFAVFVYQQPQGNSVREVFSRSGTEAGGRKDTFVLLDETTMNVSVFEVLKILKVLRFWTHPYQHPTPECHNQPYYLLRGYGI